MVQLRAAWRAIVQPRTAASAPTFTADRSLLVEQVESIMNEIVARSPYSATAAAPTQFEPNSSSSLPVAASDEQMSETDDPDSDAAKRRTPPFAPTRSDATDPPAQHLPVGKDGGPQRQRTPEELRERLLRSTARTVELLPYLTVRTRDVEQLSEVFVSQYAAKIRDVRMAGLLQQIADANDAFDLEHRHTPMETEAAPEAAASSSSSPPPPPQMSSSAEARFSAAEQDDGAQTTALQLTVEEIEYVEWWLAASRAHR